MSAIDSTTRISSTLPRLWPTDSSWGRPLDYGPVLLRKPFRFHLAVDTLPSGCLSTVSQLSSFLRDLGSARQVLLALTEERLFFPRPSHGRTMVSFDWTPIRYGNVISVLKNPFYAGAYAYGKNERRTEIVDGTVRTTYGHAKPM